MFVYSGQYSFGLRREDRIRLFSVYCFSVNFWGFDLSPPATLENLTERTKLNI